MDKATMIAEIKQYKDKNGNYHRTIKVKGGEVPLEEAPQGNVYFMWRRVTGKTK